MLAGVLAVLVAAALTWWSWRGRVRGAPARFAAAARFIGLLALLLLGLDPRITVRSRERPLVLLDNSVSMHAAGGHAAEAARLAASLGDTTTFGEESPGLPGDRSALYDALVGAAASRRPVVVVTDGEISDAASIPADLLAQATVRVVARTRRADIALTGVSAPPRLLAGDSLVVDVEARRTPDAIDTAAIVVRDSTDVLLRGVIRFGAGTHGQLRLAGPMPARLRGERWLSIERAGPADGEPDDDRRWRRVLVTATPGVVVLAETPDFDARELYRTLRDVVDAPMRGYVQLQPGAWRRMEDLKPVPAAEVTNAARGADLLAVRGDPRAWRAIGRTRLLWPAGDRAGDWYLAAGGPSPIHDAFTGVDVDSLPPAAAVYPLDADSSGGWIGAVARLSRRGAALPIAVGRIAENGRTAMLGADGLYRWSLRGGVAGQTWRTLVADLASWLLEQPGGDSARVRPAEAVTERGDPVAFRWTGSGSPAPVALRIEGAGIDRIDTLRFDAAGDATMALPVGRYRYTLAAGSGQDRGGSFAVEPFAEEVIPAPIALSARSASRAASRQGRSAREFSWLFLLATFGLAAEWVLRRRLGLR